MIELRPDQVAARNAIVNAERGIVKAPAGSGKTIIAAAALDMWLTKQEGMIQVLWLGNTKEQCDQATVAIAEFPDIVEQCFNIDVKCYQAGTSAMGYDIVIADECHHAASPEFRKIFDGHEGVRWGFSATPDREDQLKDDVFELLGPIIHTIERAGLVDAGKLAKAKVYWHAPNEKNSFDELIEAATLEGFAAMEYAMNFNKVKLANTSIDNVTRTFSKEVKQAAILLAEKYGVESEATVRCLQNAILENHAAVAPLQKDVDRATANAWLTAAAEMELKSRARWQACQKIGIFTNEPRNKAIIEIATAHVGDGESTLVLVGSVEHGGLLQQSIPGSLVLHSKMGAKNRREGMEAFRNGELKCAIATSLADEGLDVPRASALILAAAGRSAGKAEQRTGRVLREFYEKTHGTIHDFWDWQHELLRNQSRARAKVYANLKYEFCARGENDELLPAVLKSIGITTHESTGMTMPQKRTSKKCDGNHAGNPCRDKECWLLTPEPISNSGAQAPGINKEATMENPSSSASCCSAENELPQSVRLPAPVLAVPSSDTVTITPCKSADDHANKAARVRTDTEQVDHSRPPDARGGQPISTTKFLPDDGPSGASKCADDGPMAAIQPGATQVAGMSAGAGCGPVPPSCARPSFPNAGPWPAGPAFEKKVEKSDGGFMKPEYIPAPDSPSNDSNDSCRAPAKIRTAGSAGDEQDSKRECSVGEICADKGYGGQLQESESLQVRGEGHSVSRLASQGPIGERVHDLELLRTTEQGSSSEGDGKMRSEVLELSSEAPSAGGQMPGFINLTSIADPHGVLVDPPERQHARLSPSTLRGKAICSGFINDPDGDKSFAERGTLGHKGTEKEDVTLAGDDEDLRKAIQRCIDYEKKLLARLFKPGKPLEILKEIKVFYYDQHGFFDELIIQGNEAHLLDWKFAIYWYAADSPQFWAYCAGVWNAYPQIEKITVHVAHPFLGEVDREVFNRKEHYDLFMGKIAATMTKADANRPEDYRVTFQCRFCGFAKKCAKLANLAIEIGQRYADDLVIPEGPLHGSEINDPKAVAALLRLSPVMEKAAEGWRKRGLELHDSGTDIPGFKLITKNGNRKIASAKVAFDVVKKNFIPALTYEKFLEICTVSATQLDDTVKAVTPDGGKKKAADLLGAFLEDEDAMTFASASRYLMAIKKKS